MKAVPFMALGCATILVVAAARAGTVALWLFDDEADAGSRITLADATRGEFSLEFGRGAELVAGKFGRALRPWRALPVLVRNARLASAIGCADFAALLAAGNQSAASASKLTESALNLGAGEWTFECWIYLDTAAAGEGTLFEIGAGVRGATQLVTRLSVIPQENAFVLSGINTEPSSASVAGPRIEFAVADGPPHGGAIAVSATLAAAAALPRERWIHIAIGHEAETRALRLFVEGKLQSASVASNTALPSFSDAYISLGRDGSCERPFPGALDEVRLSDRALYASNFEPPGSFARAVSRPRGDAAP